LENSKDYGTVYVTFNQRKPRGKQVHHATSHSHFETGGHITYAPVREAFLSAAILLLQCGR